MMGGRCSLGLLPQNMVTEAEVVYGGANGLYRL